MARFVKVANRSEIAPGAAKKVEIEGVEIALFNIGGNFYAINGICPHQGGPLAEGVVEDTIVTCPWHGWEIDVTTGACQTDSAVTQKKYDIKVEEDDIFIAV